MAFSNNKTLSPRKRKYTYFSDGTGYHFEPTKMVNHENERINLLELHKREVKFRSSPTVYIVDDTGHILSV